MGEGVLMIYRIVLVSLIALVILGVSAVFYTHYIDIRDVEARILSREVVNCLAPEGIFQYNDFDYEKNKGKLLDYCGFQESEIERFYVRVRIFSDNPEISEKILEQGDSGKTRIKEIFDKFSEEKTEKIVKYEPGYFTWTYSVNLQNLDKNVGGKMEVEALISSEF